MCARVPSHFRAGSVILTSIEPDRKRELKHAYKRQRKAAARAAMLLDEEELESLLDFLDDRLADEGCDRTLRLTRQWAAEHAVDAAALETSLAHFGGYCDCEVLANIESEAIF
jgi:Protein of unknown function (DUF2695)